VRNYQDQGNYFSFILFSQTILSASSKFCIPYNWGSLHNLTWYGIRALRYPVPEAVYQEEVIAFCTIGKTCPVTEIARVVVCES